jgi:hypothetical protein
VVWNPERVSESVQASVANGTAGRPSGAKLTATLLVDASGYDMRVGDRASKRRRIVESPSLRSASAAKQGAARDEGPIKRKKRPRKAKEESSDTKATKRAARERSERAPQPAGPLPKGWKVVRKVHATGASANKPYKVNHPLSTDTYPPHPPSGCGSTRVPY